MSLRLQATLLDASASRGERLRAIDALELARDYFVLRNTLCMAEDGLLRAAAARRLRTEAAVPFLLEALEDRLPLVRERALGSLAALKAPDAEERVARSATEDPIWWVRRAAVWATPKVIGATGADVLIAALDDPFWRVRHAAIAALHKLGAQDQGLRRRLMALHGQTASARAAIERLRRLFAGEPGDVPQTPKPKPNGRVFNEDPAVVAARLADPAFEASPAELLELLPNSHADLRREVIVRLSQAEVPALLAVTVWLEDIRIPHASASAVAVLVSAGDRGREVARRMLREGSTRARCWAIAYAGAAGLTTLADDVRAAGRDPSPALRAIAMEAHHRLGLLPDRERLADADARVALAATRAFAAVGPLPEDAAYHPDPRVRRLRAAAGHRMDPADPDPWVRARTAPTLDDPDPIVRTAAAGDDPARALRDPDLLVRRAAIARAPETLVRGEVSAADAWTRARAAEQLSPEQDRATLVRLAQDPSSAVRRAAAERLSALDLDDLGALFPASAAGDPAPARVVQVDAVPQRRLAGMEIAPLGISGAGRLSPSSLHAAYQAGANLFFWEPGYQEMTRFLRSDAERRARIKVVAGTFSGDRRGIEADLSRALRRLRTDRLDLFLIFWVRSRERLSAEVHQLLESLKGQGKIGAFGFSTHDRTIACEAMRARPYDAVMVRHNAAHVGAEATLLPTAQSTDTSVITFSALCYGRLLRGDNAPSAADCYRYSLTQAGVSAVISAPRHHRELVENLAVLKRSVLTDEEVRVIRELGQRVYADNKSWAELVRRVPDALPERAEEALESRLDDLGLI